MSNFFNSMDVAATGMNAQRFQMDIIASNIANANTVNQVSGEPYRRKLAHFSPDTPNQFVLPVGMSDNGEEFTIGGGVKIEGRL
jgi:flagellar basal body rod protein FlgC